MEKDVMKNYNMHKSLLSIIVPVYNVSDYLKECIDSIIGQSFEDWELLLIDDGSTDGSGMICDQYSTIDSRIKSIHKPNGGLSSARNAGLDVVRGEYVTFVDGDDVIIGNDTFNQIIACFKDDIDVVQYDVLFKYKSPYEHTRKYPFKTYNGKEQILHGYLSQHIHVSCCDKFFRAKVFNNVRFPINEISEDIATIPGIINNTDKLQTINVGFYGYRYREGSISSSVLPYAKICSILRSYYTYLNYATSFVKLKPLALGMYADITWDYLSTIRKKHPDKLNHFYQSQKVLTISLKEWYKAAGRLSKRQRIRSLAVCVIGLRLAGFLQRLFTR